MPIARYIICSEKRILDQYSQLVSLINVLDAIDIAPVADEELTATKLAAGIPQYFGMVITAVWMQDDQDDPEAKYEHEIWVYPPGKRLTSSTFAFATRSHRFDVNLIGLPLGPELADTTIQVISQIRLASAAPDAQWMRQQFLIPVKVSSGGK